VDLIAYQRGARVNGSQENVNVVTVHGDHGIAIGDKFLYGLSSTNILTDRVFTASGSTATTVTFSGAAFTFPDAAFLVNIGVDSVTVNADGSWPLPIWDGSTVTMYSDSVGDNSVARLLLPNDGEVFIWVNSTPFWGVARDSGTRPCRVYQDIGGSSGPSLIRSTTAPSSPVLGDFWLKDQGAALPDIMYQYVENGDDTNDWVEYSRGQSL
jgi:hypothetical protein